MRAATPSGLLLALASLPAFGSAQTIKNGRFTVAATKQNVAPATQSISSSENGLFSYETTQLTTDVLSNLTSHQLSSISAFQFGNTSHTKRWSNCKSGCRVMPGDRDWPSKIEWFVLDLLTGGALIEGRPEAAACYKDWPEYSEEACETVTNSWTLPDFHKDFPTGIDWPLYEGITCLPPSVAPPNATCTLGGLASYVVKISNVAQIQLAINFARNLNLRLVVKNKGHDFNAKSTGAGALTIWTNYLTDIEYIPSYRTSTSSGPALKLGSGVDVLSLYEYADAHDLAAVGGVARTVGVTGGYSAGGGHSPLTSKYGMAADQILGLNVVLPDGRFVFADENSHSDLYWALRGGGGSTFGVVTSVIYRVYPKEPVATLTYSFATSDKVDVDTFWKGIDMFWGTFPQMADDGHYRYFFLSCTSATACSISMTVHWANNMTAAGLKEYNKPFFANLSSIGIEVANATYSEYDGVLSAFNTTFPASTEVMGAWTDHTGSRLWPRSNWEDEAKLAAQNKVLKETVMNGTFIIGYNIRAGENSALDQDNAVNPAWRNTLFHCMSPALWTQDATPQVIAEASKNLTDTLDMWREVSPGAGAYMSEADINEPDFQQSFYGDNYDRLYDLKQAYDPWGLFYAPTAVGSEDWYITSQIPYFPTQNGRLCPVEDDDDEEE